MFQIWCIMLFPQTFEIGWCNPSLNLQSLLSMFCWHYLLTHWGRVTYICVTKLTNIASNNGLSPGRRQAIILTNDGILLIWPLGTNFSELLIGIHIFSFKKMRLEMSSGYPRPFCPGLNVLSYYISSAMPVFSRNDNENKTIHMDFV